MKKVLSIILALLSVFMIMGLTACGEDDRVSSNVYVKYTTPDKLIPQLKQGTLSYGVLPEPAASRLERMTSGKQWTRISMQEAYNSSTKSFPQAVLMVKSGLLSAVNNIVENIKKNFDGAKVWAINNPQATIDAINANFENGLTTSLTVQDLTPQIVSNCGIYWQDANNAKTEVKKYINDILSVADSMETPAISVTDEFFYDKTEQGVFNENTIDVYMPDGAPAIAFASYMANNQTFDSKLAVKYHVCQEKDIDSKMVTGEADIIVMPLNSATLYYNANTDDVYKMVSVLTHGNLYIMCATPVSSISQLKDKTVGVIAKGKVPDFTFRAILKQNGLVRVVGE